MSRTYRRRRYRQLFGSDDPLMDFWVDEEEIMWDEVDYVKYNYNYCYYSIPSYTVKYRKNSKTGRKKIAVARSDAGTWRHKEPGPGWFRNLYVTRPLRRKAKAELRKFILDNEYEPMILADPPLPYWT